MSNLPFLKKKYQGTGIAIEVRKPDQKEQDGSEEDEHAALHACASDLLKSIQANDIAGIAKAWKSGFQILEMEPHDEVEHDSEEGQE